MTSPATADPLLPLQPGIIEGFFGRSWSWQERTRLGDFLARQGFGYYIYAPKDDACLRRQWHSPWETHTRQSLQALRDHYRHRQLGFGVGLTPLDIYNRSLSQARQQLRNKIAELNELQPDMLCILFDDMRGDLPGLADQQIRWVETIAEQSNARQFIFCPTYYSTDPVLEKVFGTRPEAYWETLGQHIDRRIDFFWTGPRVCSSHYPADSLADIAHKFRRQPWLWDNYPVNDGAVKSGFLHLKAFPASHGELPGKVAGICANPMNQPLLSRIALASLPAALNITDYQPEAAFVAACRTLCPTALAEALIEDVEIFQQQGLTGLTDNRREALISRYSALAEQHPEAGAEEVRSWLSGEYTFDPACLTD